MIDLARYFGGAPEVFQITIVNDNRKQSLRGTIVVARQSQSKLGADGPEKRRVIAKHQVKRDSSLRSEQAPQSHGIASLRSQ